MPTAAPPLAVFDIDGVLADVRHRLHFLAKKPKDWDGFFAAAHEDELLPDGYQLALTLAHDHTPLYLTGRPESIRRLTGTWLVEHALPRGRLLMRPDRDHRPARRFKQECLRRLGETYEIGLVVDDDPQVVETLLADGLPVRLAEWLPYVPMLRDAQETDGRT